MTNDQLESSSHRPLPAKNTQDFDEAPTETRDDTSFPIVGIGASAGGLEAFTQLLKALPCDTGMAFVLMQHLAPTHASALAEILSRATKMPVMEVQDEPTVEPNHVYVIPPAQSMIIAGDTLQLLPREGTGMHRPIDQFFRSLAEAWRHRAVASSCPEPPPRHARAEAIRPGGITFAQDVGSARGDAAQRDRLRLWTLCVPDEIARGARIGHHPYVVPKMNVRATDDKPICAQIVQILHQTTGVDFTHYKFNTLYRRITRRMVLQKLDDLSQYVEFLRKTPVEVEALYQDILISVTSFFRDPESFDALKSVVFPPMLKEQEAANEELQSANEEVQSANEELQSTNEELETSKEEIQSSNEELATVNDELNNRNAELHRVNNDLVNLVASIQSAVVMLGPDLRVRRYTPSAEALLNLIPTDVGRPLADIKLNLDGLPDLASLLKAVLDTADPSECEVLDKQGRWCSLRLIPYRTVDNLIDGVVVTLVDVDAIKRAHEYTESIVATVREPLLVLDKDLRVQSASRSFYETFQTASDDTIDRPLFELGNGQWDIPDLRRLLVEVLPLENNVTDFEMNHEFEKIGRKSMRLNARRLIQAADQAPLILLAIEDITERRQVEDQLQKNDERLRAIMDAIPQKIFTADPDGHIDYFNLQWTEFTAKSMEEMHDSGWTNYVHPDDLARKSRLWLDAFETGEQFQSEHRFRRADGEYRWHFSRATPLRNETGRILMWVGSNTDVFSDKPANESIVRELQTKGYLRIEHLPLKSKDGRLIEVEVVANAYQEDHNSVIQLNIRDITERSHMETVLRRQAVQLSELHHRKDEFLAMLSHELRSPLAPIANAVQLFGLQRAGESRIQQQARGIIERQVRQLQHLVDDLLEVSRITTGRVQLRLERIDMCCIAEGAVETVRPLIEQRRHELTVSLPQEPLWIVADAARLEQVLVNLLTNASKYTVGGGHIWLTVELEGLSSQESGSSDQLAEQSSPEPHVATSKLTPDPCFQTPAVVVIRVRDTGVGISPALLPHIFDLFTQADRSLDRSQGGLGIGLALVQRLTELHGGHVEALSMVGEGSEFVVRLPLLSDEGRGARNESDAHSSHAPHPSLLAPPLKVLVVDDNVDTVLGFSMLLTAAGHDVRTAHDGLSAVEAAIEYRPDVVLLDIGLPGLNGYEVAKRIRMQPVLRNTVLIALTGYGQDTDRQASQQAGFNHHLVKPARFEQLKRILATVQEGLKLEGDSC
ncbi:MAG: chemotaxis protein CheB [Planctomycetaceae bacterium]